MCRLPQSNSSGRPRPSPRRYTVEEARAYTRWLATSHYENFHVVSFLLPKRLHQDFYNVYSYCRWADDLGDEIGDRAREPAPAGLVARRTGRHVRRAAPRIRCSSRCMPTVQQYGIPRQPFSDLIDAFVQDQTVTRYRNWDELFGYCRNSANPVGRLVLYLCGYSDAAAAAPLRRHLHRAATRQLLAGRDRGPAQGPRLHSARYHGAARLHRRGPVRAPLHAGLSRGDARDRGQGARAVPRRACRSPAWWTGAWRSTSTCSAAAACACSTRSNSRTTTCWPRGRPSRRPSACGCCCGSLARIAFSRAA